MGLKPLVVSLLKSLNPCANSYLPIMWFPPISIRPMFPSSPNVWLDCIFCEHLLLLKPCSLIAPFSIVANIKILNTVSKSVWFSLRLKQTNQCLQTSFNRLASNRCQMKILNCLTPLGVVGLMKKAFSGSTPWPTTVNKAQKILVQARLTRFASSTSYSTRSSAGWCWLASLRKILLPSNILRKNFFWIFKTLWSLQGKPSHKKPSKHFFTFYSVREVNVNLGLMVKAQNLVACSMGHEFKLNC